MKDFVSMGFNKRVVSFKNYIHIKSLELFYYRMGVDGGPHARFR